MAIIALLELCAEGEDGAIKPSRVGLARTVLRDRNGPIGLSLQTLFVAERAR